MVYLMECHWGKKMELYWALRLDSKYVKLHDGVNGEVNMLVVWFIEFNLLKDIEVERFTVHFKMGFFDFLL